MSISPIEIQVLAASMIAVPVMIVLLVAFLRGSFARAESAKYLAVREKDEDYWSDGPAEDGAPGGSPVSGETRRSAAGETRRSAAGETRRSAACETERRR